MNQTAPSAEVVVAATARGYWSTVLARLSRDKLTVTCALILLGVLLMAICAPLLAPYDPFKGSILKRLLPIGSPGYFLGTDELGRDMLSRLLHGGRVSLGIGLAAVVMSLVPGVLLGLLPVWIAPRLSFHIALLVAGVVWALRIRPEPQAG